MADATYLESMQSINRAILNPAFFLIFFGSLLFLSVASVFEFHANKTVFWLMLVASIFYLVGTVGVTGLGNVPLNNQMDALELSDISTTKMAEFRRFYESNWNRLHLIRTVFAVASFVLSVLALFIQSNTDS